MDRPLELVVGLLFDEGYEDIVLLQKISKGQREWMDGKWNGPGGKIEPGETALDAVVREFYEETGVITEREDWNKFLEFHDEGAIIHFFYGAMDSVYDADTITDEEVVVTNAYDALSDFDLVPNLTWMIPFLQDRSIEHDLGIRFNINEDPREFEPLS